MDAPVPREAAYDDHVLVLCPNCDGRASVDARSGFVRLTCAACGYVQEVRPSHASGPIKPESALAVYGSGNTLFGARLWLATECCGGKQLWALNRHHLDYLEAFVASTQRRRDFPSTPGHRQLAEKLPPWMIEAKHRDEVLKALQKLRARL